MERFLSQIKWRYALGEILLIFIGITTAISFNNWNEARKTRKTEIQTLREIKNGIQQDINDMQDNISGYTTRESSYSTILKYAVEKRPYSEELEEELYYIQSRTTFISNIGPYEMLKSRGLDIISNDSLRVKISIYYDVLIDIILESEKEHHEHYQNYLKPAMMQHFHLDNYELVPINYNQLIEDFEFIQTMHWAHRNHQFLIEIYGYVLDRTLPLVTQLDAELERLSSQ